MENDSIDIEKATASPASALVRAEPQTKGSYGYGYGYGAPEGEEMHLKDLWRIVRKHKWVVISITLAATTFVAVQMSRTPSIYQASAIVEVDKGTQTATKAGDLIVEDNDIDSLKTKILMIKSQPVLQDAVKQLNLQNDPAFLQSDSKSVVQTLKALVHRGGAEAAPNTSEHTGPDSTAGVSSGADPAAPPDESTLESYANMIDGGLSADLIPDTRAIRISYSHTNSKMAAAVANQVANSFMTLSFKTQTANFTSTSDWLEKSTRELKAQVEKAEQALADYTKSHNIFSEGNQTLTTGKLASLHDLATRAQTERILKQSLYEEVKAGHLAQLPEAYIDSRLGGLRDKLQELQSEAADLSVKFGPKNPKVIQVNQELALTQEQIDTGMQLLEGKLKAEYERAVADEQSLNRALEAAKAEAVKENQDEIQFSILKQDVDTAKSLYTDFLQKTNQSNLQVAEQHSNMRLLQPAQVPGAPVGPKRTLNILMAFMLSFASGIGLAFFMEYLDNTIKSVDEIGRYLQLPTLGVIPAISAGGSRKMLGRGKERAVKREETSLTPQPRAAGLSAATMMESHSSAAEAYRSLRTSVLLSAAGQPPKTLLITSGQPGEGKTTTVANTAVSLAQLGAEVLIVDADLRKPALHKVFGVVPSSGLSTFLSRTVSIDQLIVKTSIPHLSVMPSGPIPPNPAELLSSDQMRDMLKILSERYDHILIDSPPLINVTDPVILSTMVDGVMLVVRWGKSTRDIARKVRAELTGVGAKVFGVVLNNVDFRREGYDDYYYYRYYTDYASNGKDATA